jgi:peptide methionine sulfoxide reductase MsrB
MKQLEFLKTIYSDLLTLGAQINNDFSTDVLNKITELQLDVSFIEKAMLLNSKHVFESVYIKYASDYNYESGFYFKKNYDLGEGWTAFLDAYRDGKVKSIREWVAKRRRTKKPKKDAAARWMNQVFTDNNKEYKVSDIHQFINDNRIAVSELSIATLAETNLKPSPQDTYTSGDYPGSPKFVERAERASLTFPIIVIQYPDGMFIADGVHRLWKARALGHSIIKGHVISEDDLHQIPSTDKIIQASFVSPIDSYCNSDDNTDYWQELLDGEDDEAVKDFIKYVKEVKC